jgi:hypothetical protein
MNEFQRKLQAAIAAHQPHVRPGRGSAMIGDRLALADPLPLADRVRKARRAVGSGDKTGKPRGRVSARERAENNL